MIDPSRPWLVIADTVLIFSHDRPGKVKTEEKIIFMLQFLHTDKVLA
jgi:hypothetical protein